MKFLSFFVFIFLFFFDFAVSGISYKLKDNAVISDEESKMICQNEICSIPAVKDYNFKNNDVIVSLYGSGYIRKIVSVKKNKYSYEIVTEPASMEDAFESLKMDYTKEIKPSDVNLVFSENEGVEVSQIKKDDNKFTVKLKNLVIHDFDNNPQTTDDRITVNGFIDFVPSIDINLNIEESRLKDFIFKSRIIQNSDFKLNISSHVNIPLSFGKSIKLCEYKMTPVVIGPVVFTPVFSVILGISLNAKGEISLNTTQKIDYTGGLNYLNGEWYKISKLNDKSFAGGVSFLGAETNLKAYIGPKFLINFYDTLGPYVNSFAYLKLTADINTKPSSVLWNLYGGLEANAGVNLKILTYFQKDFNKNLIDYSICIKSGVFEKKEKSVYDIENTEINLLSPDIIKNFEKGF